MPADFIKDPEIKRLEESIDMLWDEIKNLQERLDLLEEDEYL